MANKRVVADSGPIIHLNEVEAKPGSIFSTVFVPDVVKKEVEFGHYSKEGVLDNFGFELLNSICLAVEG